MSKGAGNPRYKYLSELEPHLARSTDEVHAFARRLIDSGNARDMGKAVEFSRLLRRRGRLDEAVCVARSIFEAQPTAQHLNLYLVVVVDQGDIENIRRIGALIQEYIEAHPDELHMHLVTTWLKAANQTQDDRLFDYILSLVPDHEKATNGFLVVQRLVHYLNHAQYEEIRELYRELPDHLKKNPHIAKQYDIASSRLGYDTEEDVRDVRDGGTAKKARLRRDVSLADKSAGTIPAEHRHVFIVYGGVPRDLATIKALLAAYGIQYTDLAAETKTGQTILEAFISHAQQTDFALVLLTPADQRADGVWQARQNVIFECGYFMGFLGRESVCLIGNKDGAGIELPSDFHSLYVIDIERGQWASEMLQALGAAGFDIPEQQSIPQP